jgi:hypothetical protein
MTCHKAGLEEPPYISVIRVIFEGYPIVQTATCCPKAEEGYQDDGFQPAIPEKGHPGDYVTKDDAINNK